MQKETKTNNLQIPKHRVVTMVDRRELEFLDKLGKDSLFSTGHKLSYNKILSSLIEFAMEIGLSADKIDSLNKLKERILEQMYKRLEENKNPNQTEKNQEA